MSKPILYSSNSDSLFHYTDTAGLIGILTSGTLWATNMRFLNDSLEYTHGLNMITSAMEEALEEGKKGEIDGVKCDSDLEAVVELGLSVLNSSSEDRRNENFVCCFSKWEDDLGQWRGYAPGGYCLKFRRSEFLDSIRRREGESESVRSSDVFYGENIGWGVSGFAKRLLQRVRTMLDYDDDTMDALALNEKTSTVLSKIYSEHDRTMLAAMEIGAQSYSVLPFWKEQGFADEQEYRVCFSGRESVKFRPSNLGPIPYIEASFNPNTLESVVVGPGPDLDLRMETARYFLDEVFRGTGSVRVEPTRLSFRG